MWIQPGQEVNVAVQIAVPNTQDPVPSTVTLYVEGSENFEVVEKSTYVYVEGPGVTVGLLLIPAPAAPLRSSPRLDVNFSC